jgi:hypothetical protein
MVDATKFISAPFTLFSQTQGQIAIRRKGSIIRM